MVLPAAAEEPGRHGLWRACRGDIDAALYSQIRSAIQALLQHSHPACSGSAADCMLSLDLSLNGYMHLLTPLTSTLPLSQSNLAQLDSKSSDTPPADARSYVDKLLQSFADEASGRLAPQLPPLDPTSAPSLRKDPVAANAHVIQKPKAPPLIPLGEVCHPFAFANCF
jgi:hypothetical protein